MARAATTRDEKDDQSDRFWAKGAASSCGLLACFGTASTLTADINELLQHQPSVLVQPHIPELFRKEFLVVMHGTQPLLTFVAERGVVANAAARRIQELRTDLPGATAALLLPDVRHLTVLHTAARLTAELLQRTIPAFRSAPLYRIDLALVADGSRALVNEVQTDLFTRLFASDTSLPILDLQTRLVEQRLFELLEPIASTDASASV